jgi:F-type H+-transporting ATPase subunit c
MSKRTARIALLMICVGFVTMFASVAPAHAQEAGGTGVAAPSNNLAWAGAAVGSGLVIIGGSLGIGRIGGSAVEAIARQPEANGQISTAMIITAALIEGVTLFALIICVLAVIK